VHLAAPDPRPATTAAPTPGKAEEKTPAPVAPPVAAAPQSTPPAAPPKPKKSAGPVHEPDYDAAMKQIAIPAETERDMVEAFVVEAKELLQGAEAAMLKLEDHPEDQASVDTVFRAFHTVKGVTAMLGLAVIADFAHRAENLLSRVRDKEIRFEGGYAGLALRSLDAVNALVDGVGRTAAGETAYPPDDLPELLRALTDP
jgi:two-component system chemotaxis sensor kinase CheA